MCGRLLSKRTYLFYNRFFFSINTFFSTVSLSSVDSEFVLRVPLHDDVPIILQVVLGLSVLISHLIHLL